jgi:hypothetical protein
MNLVAAPKAFKDLQTKIITFSKLRAGSSLLCNACRRYGRDVFLSVHVEKFDNDNHIFPLISIL